MSEQPQPSPGYPACDRSTLGRLCGRPCLWEAPACLAHITREEEAVRELLRPSARDMAMAIFNGRAEPACWSWPVPAVLPVFPDDDSAMQYLADWHERQCAVCGCPHPEATDHDHRTGLIRGKLCRPCNVQEGRSDAPLYRNYRERHPAVILGIVTRYWSPWSGWAQPEPEAAGSGRALRAAVDRLSLPSPDELAGTPANLLPQHDMLQ